MDTLVLSGIGLGCQNPPLCGMEHPGRIGGQVRCQERLGPTWSDGRESKEGSVGTQSSRETFPKAEERSDYSPHKHSCVCVCTLSCVQLFETPWTLAHQAPHPRDFPGKNTGVSCHSLLQGIFLSQESNSRLLCLLH